VGDQQHRQAEAGQDLPQLAAPSRVEVGRRLVEDEDRRVAREDGGRGDALALPERQVVRRLVAVLFLRALERGERVYLAMLSRGYTGAFPALPGEALVLRQVDVAAGVALAASVTAIRVGLG
jgi:cobalt/nickel transport system permease protein